MKMTVKILHFSAKLGFEFEPKYCLTMHGKNQQNSFGSYPPSMITVRRNELKRIWNELYHKFITENNTPIKLSSESIAPFTIAGIRKMLIPR